MDLKERGKRNELLSFSIPRVGTSIIGEVYITDGERTMSENNENSISKEKFEQLLQKAESGVAEAQFYLGACCELGYGVSKNKAEAAKWYRKAAEQENAKALFSLGLCYEVGYVFR